MSTKPSSFRAHSLFSPQTMVIYLLTIVLGGIYALIAPTLSLYLSHETGARPFAVGAFFFCMAVASITYGHFIGAWSDKLKQRHGLILVGLLMNSITCFIFASTRNYWIILFTAVTFFSVANAVLPQIFAITREYADQRLPLEKTTLFNSIVRACLAIAWVGAPPMGFYLQTTLGFAKQYYLVGFLYLGFALIAFYALPRVPKVIAVKSSLDSVENNDSAEDKDLAENKTYLIPAVAAFALLFASNHSYVLGLPLLITRELHEPATTAGWLMGTAAALEIPVMLLAGWLANRFSLVVMIRFGCAAAVILYACIWQSSNVAQLFALQILNAIFVGCYAGLGITLFQNMVPGKAGAASTLFTNTNQLGNILGSGFIAIFAELFGYRNLYGINMVAATLALGALFLIKHQRPKIIKEETTA